VANLRGSSANFLKTFPADGIAQDRAATWQNIPADGKISIGFAKVGVSGDACLRWDDVDL